MTVSSLNKTEAEKPKAEVKSQELKTGAYNQESEIETEK